MTTDTTQHSSKAVCPVCGGFKFAHEEHCIDCEKYRREVEDHDRWRRRREHFGRLLP